MESNSQDRNLPATERKLQKARKDGQASRSKDLSHLAVLGTGSLALVLLAPYFLEQFKRAFGRHLAFNTAAVSQPDVMLTRLQDMATVGLIASVAFSVLVIAAALLSTVAAGGWIASAKPLMPDFNRINPLAGLGRMFTKQQLADVVKLVFITAILVTIAVMFLSSSLHTVASLVMQPSVAALKSLASWLTSGIGLLLLVVLAAAIIDVPLQAFFLRQRLRMSHEEVKQEHKESDGNPLVKGQLRARQREISQRNSVRAVPKADFVLMNPTHFAVAIKYDEKTMAAPQVISKGADLLAMKIREVAKASDVPVLQSPALARALYAHAELDKEIPSSLFTAVAQVLAYVYRLKMAMRGDGPMPLAQPEPDIPAGLDPLSVTEPAT
ncbi:MAG TPA: EscU/YscU/HrcU family type III secretion system export apparatus switch protein [Burkholderiaceae bacterium]|nr:EscU/YscU/HrcU family type III secretion system export apparatus switch protein [Burkholderiaceae bacterium]